MSTMHAMLARSGVHNVPLLLLLAISFSVEEVFFLGHALGQAGHNQPNSFKFLVQTIGVFFTTAAALMFARRDSSAVARYLSA